MQKFACIQTVVAVGLILSSPAITRASDDCKLYWVDGFNESGLYGANMDGSQVELLLPEVYDMHVIALDPVERKVYVSDYISIKRSGIDEIKMETFITLGGSLDWEGSQLAVDAKNRDIYWASYFPIFPPQVPDTTIYKMSLEGGDPVTVLTEIGSIIGLAVDPVGEKIYWLNLGLQNVNNDSKIARSNLDGSNVEVLRSNIPGFGHIGLDISNNHLYWVDGTANHIRRMSLTGTDVQTVLNINSSDIPLGLALDLADNKLCWSEYGAPASIGRANLDGTNPQTIVVIDNGQNFPGGLAIWRCNPGDVNNDLAVNAADIDPFVNALINGWNGETFCGADANEDRQIDALDIQPFVDCLLQGGCAPCRN